MAQSGAARDRRMRVRVSLSEQQLAAVALMQATHAGAGSLEMLIAEVVEGEAAAPRASTLIARGCHCAEP